MREELDYLDMDWEDAYNIQYAIRARKIARGTKIAGLKMGLTSRAKMKQMGVEQPVYGFLTDYGACPEGGEIETDRFIHPRIEAEVAVEEDWLAEVISVHERLLMRRSRGWFTGYNENVEGRESGKVRYHAYFGGANNYTERISAVADSGYSGLDLSAEVEP